MKKSIIAISLLTTLITGNTHAEYTVKIKLDGNINFRDWSSTNTVYGNWINVGNIYDCNNWTPSPSTILTGMNFEQTANDCQQNQERAAQDQALDKVSGKIENIGASYTDKQTINVSSTRIATGILENWIAIVPFYGSWLDNGLVYDCTTWTPDPSTITLNTTFTQTSNDCKKNQDRTVQGREQETTTSEIRNVGAETIESRILTAQTSDRSSIGTKETWSSTEPAYTEWVNNGSITSCSNWSPATSTVSVGQSFTQTATDCQQPQTRSKQEREQETTTLEYRNKGVEIIENNTIFVNSTREETGTKENWAATTSTYTTWVNNGVLANCSNWSPATSTVTVGQTFTQTATDCDQQQTRSRQDREQESTTLAYRNKGSAVTENQTIKASTTRSATGTKENWVTTTPTYSDWTNTGSLYDCNWTPSQSTILNQESFTQTATTCKQNQTRKQQNREQETTTLEYRNVGSAVDMNNTINVNDNLDRSSTGTAPCLYNIQSGVNINYWNIQSVRLRIAINNKLYTLSGDYKDITSVVINGITYRRGMLSASTDQYEICR